MKTSIVTAIIVIAIAVLFYVYRKSQLKNKAKTGDYHIPLSDDIQKTYFDEYEKEQAENKAAQTSEAGEEKKQGDGE